MTLAVPHYALAVLCGVSGAAGFIDAIAGGGGLLTVPALMSFVPSPHLALGTNKGQSVFGAIASAVSFWRAGGLDRHRAPLAFACGAAGAVLGALLQLRVSNAPLKPIVLGLLLFAAALVAFRPLLLRGRKPHETKAPRARLASIALIAGVYDGFFGPGVGSLLIVAFVAFAGDSMTRASGNAKVVNLASNLTSFCVFAVKGTILWSVALPMAACNALGAWVGAHTAMKRGDAFVRVVVLMVVLSLAGKLGWDLLRRV